MSKSTAEQSTNPSRRCSTSRAIKVPHSVIVKLPGLLPMAYAPSELEAELGITSRTIREWIPKGLPYQRDSQGHIWINGKEFAGWLNTMRRRRQRQPLEPDEAYCFRCNRPVKMENPSQQYHGKQVLLSATCSHCGHSIHRGGRNG